jgi:hypothetical protein
MGAETPVICQRLVRGEVVGKVMRENEPVLLVLSVCDGEIILENGEILSEKRQERRMLMHSCGGLRAVICSTRRIRGSTGWVA